MADRDIDKGRLRVYSKIIYKEILMNQATAKRGRPFAAKVKKPIYIRLDKEIIAGFSADGPGWMTRMNDVLADWVKQHRPEAYQNDQHP